VLDVDSTEIPVYGQQGQSVYKKHYESTCYHRLLLFIREGDCVASELRPGFPSANAGFFGAHVLIGLVICLRSDTIPSNLC
jgi:hypothetical protein